MNLTSKVVHMDEPDRGNIIPKSGVNIEKAKMGEDQILVFTYDEDEHGYTKMVTLRQASKILKLVNFKKPEQVETVHFSLVQTGNLYVVVRVNQNGVRYRLTARIGENILRWDARVPLDWLVPTNPVALVTLEKAMANAREREQRRLAAHQRMERLEGVFSILR